LIELGEGEFSIREEVDCSLMEFWDSVWEIDKKWGRNSSDSTGITCKSFENIGEKTGYENKNTDRKTVISTYELTVQS
jgi:hypothetical protein